MFLGEAILMVVYLINKIPTSHSSAFSQFEKLNGNVPNYSSLHVFGCTCFFLPDIPRLNSTAILPNAQSSISMSRSRFYQDSFSKILSANNFAIDETCYDGVHHFRNMLEASGISPRATGSSDTSRSISSMHRL